MMTPLDAHHGRLLHLVAAARHRHDGSLPDAERALRDYVALLLAKPDPQCEMELTQ